MFFFFLIFNQWLTTYQYELSIRTISFTDKRYTYKTLNVYWITYLRNIQKNCYLKYDVLEVHTILSFVRGFRIIVQNNETVNKLAFYKQELPFRAKRF